MAILKVENPLSEMLGTERLSDFGFLFRLWNICVNTMGYLRDGTNASSLNSFIFHIHLIRIAWRQFTLFLIIFFLHETKFVYIEPSKSKHIILSYPRGQLWFVGIPITHFFDVIAGFFIQPITHFHHLVCRHFVISSSLLTTLI